VLELLELMATWPEHGTFLGTIVLLAELAVAAFLICGEVVTLGVAPYHFELAIAGLAAGLLLLITVLHATRVEISGATRRGWSDSYARSVWPLCFMLLGAEVAAYFAGLWLAGEGGVGAAIFAGCGGLVGLLGLGAWVHTVRRP
jgi:hypothetical protein